MSGWKIKGITDDTTECECCGRINLRRTVALAPLDAEGNEDGEVSYFGTSCAARKVGTTTAKMRGAIESHLMREEIERDRNRTVARIVLRVLEGHNTGRERFNAWRGAFPNGAPFATPTGSFSGAIEWARGILAV